MLDRLPQRLRFAFSKPVSPPEPAVATALDTDEVDFVAYGEDCVLAGRMVLDGDRLTDMLNDHEEYALLGVTVERFDDGQPIEIDEVVVGRDELFLVHADGPRGNVARRKVTASQCVAVKMGPYEVRGFFHGPPGTDPVDAIRRRKAMVPLTDGRIEYVLHGERRDTRVETVIMNREQIDWIEAIEADREAFPSGPRPAPASPKPAAADPEPSPAGSKRPTARRPKRKTTDQP
jgi:hypothetical protein